MSDYSARWKADCIKWRGKVLTGAKSHWCHDWDGLPVDETTPEIDSCCCLFDPDIDDLKGQMLGAEDSPHTRDIKRLLDYINRQKAAISATRKEAFEECIKILDNEVVGANECLNLDLIPQARESAKTWLNTAAGIRMAIRALAKEES